MSWGTHGPLALFQSMKAWPQIECSQEAGVGLWWAPCTWDPVPGGPTSQRWARSSWSETFCLQQGARGPRGVRDRLQEYVNCRAASQQWP